ncbi:MAG: hypothetical protein K1X55_17305 [Chitinophagales bacterium]|nr:hypothetical protein [Chitinophagales bacterium]
MNKWLSFVASIIICFSCKQYYFIESNTKGIQSNEFAKEQKLGYKRNFQEYMFLNNIGKRMKGIIFENQKYPIILVRNKSNGQYFISVDHSNIVSNIPIDCVNPNLKLLSTTSDWPEFSDSVNVAMKDDSTIICFTTRSLGTLQHVVTYQVNGQFISNLMAGWLWKFDTTQKIVKTWLY